MHFIAPLLALCVSEVLAIATIEAKGAKLFTSDGAQFFIKGVAYQLTSDDPLADTQQCQLDAALMKTLGANSIRVYHVDAGADHDGCMSAFSDVGIYAWIDLDTTGTYILANGNPPTWTQAQYNAYAAVMDTFQKYDNVAGFFVGNEMLTIGADSSAAPYVKAAGRDMKAYREKKGYRNIPIGYSAADIPALRPNLQNYMACGSDPSAALDFYSLNAYEWCGDDSSYTVSGYDILQQNATNYNIPIFFSETGCIVPPPRTFDDQDAILGPDMDGTWSGAIIYEWIEEANNYGLISYGPPANPTAAAGNGVVAGFTRTGTPTPISPDFNNLKSHWATLNPTGISANAYSPTLTPPACPSYTAGDWEVSGDVKLPTIGASGTSYTTASPTFGASGSSGSSTSSSSAASATKSVSLGLQSRDLSTWKKNHAAAWWVIIAILSVLGAAVFV